MQDSAGIPQISPTPVQAIFLDFHGARTAIETMLQGGFLGEQLSLMAAEASIPSPANDMNTYRASGAESSVVPLPSEITPHSIIVSVQPVRGQEPIVREMLVALGGRLLRLDGSLESEAA